MKKIYLSLSLTFLFTTLALAQSNFKPGYVVTLKGDTVKGEVDYQEWGSNPTSIRFRTPDNKIRNFTPTDIKYFNIDKLDIYQRYSGPVSRDETNNNRVLGGRDTSFTVQDVFLKVLQTGKVINLYSYLDAIKPRYFYSDPGADNAVHELVYRVYYNGNTGEIQKSKTTIEATYLQQLTAIALKANLLDDRLQQTMDGAEYNKPDLLKIATAMNGYTKDQVASTQPSGSNDNFDLYVGLGVNTTKTTSRDQNGDAAGVPYNSILPRAVIGFNAYVNPNTRRLVFSIEFSVTDIKYKNTFLNTSYSFDQLVTSLTPSVSYNVYNGDNFKFYLSLGFGISKYTFFNKKFLKYDGTPLPNEYLPFLFSSYNNAITYKVGFLIYKKFQVYAEHLSGNPISRDSVYGLKQTSYNFGVNYILGKQK
ncbi:outer membrane beta-barrel protein [Mucilaginibacter gilvus]|uniref:Uncharacterized protein n=1 Tax=Mucilaginibacter gilvus TaxID=2305909 RepID=A0A444MSL6_9SPHI|nr:outer membrane beta-barrel protein [Mucilaginibacter gilvus]RWY55610.1 hypothetical protein EPL05_04325 [Mucilaginibacter gilvus]